MLENKPTRKSEIKQTGDQMSEEDIILQENNK